MGQMGGPFMGGGDMMSGPQMGPGMMPQMGGGDMMPQMGGGGMMPQMGGDMPDIFQQMMKP